MSSNRTLYSNDCLNVLQDPLALPDESVDLIYLDPPFNSNSNYNLPFKGSYKSARPVQAFKDTWSWGAKETEQLEAYESGPQTKILADIVRAARTISSRGGTGNSDLGAYLVNMSSRLLAMRRILNLTGSLWVHCDPTASHYLKLVMDAIYGAKNFRNEIAWVYGLGGSSRRYFSKKHDILFFYTKSDDYFFDKPTVPATSARMRGQQKGMLDVWTDIPSLNNMAKERLGYPTQKPVDLLERIIEACSQPDDLVLDPFCGCGTTVEAAERLGRRWVGIDISSFAVGLIRERVEQRTSIPKGLIRVYGVPVEIAEARALARNDKFEFEKWVCGHLGAHGMYHPPGTRGADRGVDGVIKCYPFKMGEVPKEAVVIVQVKGGNVTPDSVRALATTVREVDEAIAGVIVCFGEQMRTVENNRTHDTFEDDAGIYPVIQGLSVEDMLSGEEPCLPIRASREGGRVTGQFELT